ncbi:hypothetical protein B7494_g3434 [Chlorociboria aeruginascens]|nr:hypothetical protein B7494_g3434 [Chlorociboria aeruginascens]
MGHRRLSETPAVALTVDWKLRRLAFPDGKIGITDGEVVEGEPPKSSPSTNISASPVLAEIENAANATLGFEKILMIGLKERSDRRDTMALQSSLTGFQIEWLNGVRGVEVADKALPVGMERGMSGEAEIGSWRGHINAIRHVLEIQASSALIMEDDLDWDIRLLEQMPEFAKGVRNISDIPLDKPQHSPYGDDWDVLWPGHCGDVFPKGDDRRYIISNDTTVAPKAHQPWLAGLADYPDYTRIVHKAGAPICSFAYAVSRRGAQKLLWALGIRGDPQKGGANSAFDNNLAWFCQDGFLDLKCVSVEPMLFFHHRPAGPMNKDSDIQNGDASQSREIGFTEQIVLSTRLNMKQLIMGTKDYVMQWDT